MYYYTKKKRRAKITYKIIASETSVNGGTVYFTQFDVQKIMYKTLLIYFLSISLISLCFKAPIDIYSSLQRPRKSKALCFNLSNYLTSLYNHFVLYVVFQAENTFIRA